MASINLGDLGRQAGEAKLRDVFGRYKIRHLDLVPRAVATFGSNPLVLEIMARFCKGKRRQTIIKLIGSGEDGARDGLQGEAAQRFLYSRILERIGDKALRDVASPGLVLRRVTVQLVRNVLAGRCSLPATLTDQDARNLLNKLVNQIWLVDRVSLDEVTHRRDLGG
ncbi:hypothetical protein AJ88_15570 [Mesorhizobium amorphae CCBAU 01583]|nr:hypothetical protein AJ88_15570 [Mesorhizobium amorphae CCBAU 01583]